MAMYQKHFNQIKSIYGCVTKEANICNDALHFFKETFPLSMAAVIDGDIAIAKKNLPALVLFKVSSKKESAYIAAGICIGVRRILDEAGKSVMEFLPESIAVFLDKQTPDMLPKALPIPAKHRQLFLMNIEGLADLCKYLDEKISLCQTTKLVNSRTAHTVQQYTSSIEDFKIKPCAGGYCYTIRELREILYNEAQGVLTLYGDISASDTPVSFRMPEIVISYVYRKKICGKYRVKTLLAEVAKLKEKVKQFSEAKRGCSVLNSLEDILDRLIECLNNNELSPEDAIAQLDEIGRHIEELFNASRESRKEIQKLFDEIQKLSEKTKNIRKEIILYGTYSATKNEITLYVCAICEYCMKNNRDFTSKLISIFAHEMFHAIHYFAVADNHNKDLDEALAYWTLANKTIIESLARYFEYEWCNKNSSRYGRFSQCDDIASDLLKEANENRFPGWPYAGAKVFMKLSKYNAIREFCDVMYESLIV